jgi:hypothetical protein
MDERQAHPFYRRVDAPIKASPSQPHVHAVLSAVVGVRHQACAAHSNRRPSSVLLHAARMLALARGAADGAVQPPLWLSVQRAQGNQQLLPAA